MSGISHGSKRLKESIDRPGKCSLVLGNVQSFPAVGCHQLEVGQTCVPYRPARLHLLETGGIPRNVHWLLFSDET